MMHWKTIVGSTLCLGLIAAPSYGFVAASVPRAVMAAVQTAPITHPPHSIHRHMHCDVVIEREQASEGPRPVSPTTEAAAARAVRAVRAGGVSTTPDNQILVELAPEDTTLANLFDLNGKTLVFTPDGQGGYSRSVQSVAWEDDIGESVEDDTEFQLENFVFDFAGRRWGSFFVSRRGLISFGERLTYDYGRWDPLSQIAKEFVTTPMISPLYKPDLGGHGDRTGTQHVKAWPDRVVVTWKTTEPRFYVHGVAPKKWSRLQAVLAADGSIRFNYVDVDIGDGIVGLFPAEEVSRGERIGGVVEAEDSVPGHVDLLEAAIYKSNTDEVIVEWTMSDAIPVPANEYVYSYRLHFDIDEPYWTRYQSGERDLTLWVTIDADGERAIGGRRLPSQDGNRIVLLADLGDIAGRSAVVIAEAVQFDNEARSVLYDRSLPFRVDLPGLTPATDLSSSELYFTNRQREVFHYRSMTNLDEIACRVIDALGDEFDLFVFHTEFRLDTQEQLTPWRSYRDNVDVDGVGLRDSRTPPCGAKRLKGRWVLPVWMSSDAVFDEGSSWPGFSGYDLGLYLFAHEFMHTWTAYGHYMRHGVREPLFRNDYCACHWRRDLHSPAAFPWFEEDIPSHSIMGASYWHDNDDGTFRQFRGWYGGPSWLDLYAMGLADASEVPDMFILRNLLPANGRKYSGEKETVTISQIVAAEGPRLPPPEHAQKVFNAGFVYLLEPGATPTDSLLGLHRDYMGKVMEYWSQVTGGRSQISNGVSSAGNLAPVPVGTLPDLGMQVHDVEDVDVKGAFRDPEGDRLAYKASSSAPDVVSVSVSNSTLKVTAEAAGTVVVTVMATDTDGSNRTATQKFEVTVGEMRESSSRLFVPIVLRSQGTTPGSLFTTELTLTNRSTTNAALHYTYTAAFGGGSGTAVDSLKAGEQRVIPDAIAYLTSLGVPIGKGSAGGTIVVDVSNLSSASDAAVTARVATLVEEGRGRAGLAFPGLMSDGLLTGPVFITGLRENRQDRSNVALQNAGIAGHENITLRVTVFSGDPEAPGSSLVLKDRTLPPGGFHQYNRILDRAGFDNGYVKVEQVEGNTPFYAYGVVNDNFNSDGSFVFPVREDSLTNTRGQTVPVIIETGAFNSELTVTNFSATDKTLQFSFVADEIASNDDTATFSLTLKASEQRILPRVVNWLRQQNVEGVGQANRAFVGALFAKVAEGDMSGIVIGVRTGVPDQRGGQYSLFYNGVPFGSASTDNAWIYGLQQNAENRSNLALVNTGEIDDTPSTFEITIYDGTGESGPRTRSVKLGPRRWSQINGILGSTSQGYVQVRKTSGNNPFITYGVINDGGKPGERSGDGAYLPAQD